MNNTNTKFKCKPAKKLSLSSRKGYAYEEKVVPRLIKMFGGRPATKEEQLKQGLDYISATGASVDIKHQPRAYSFRSINIEVLEYNTKNPSINNPGSWYHSQADSYWWCIQDDDTAEQVLVFDKKALAPYIDEAIQRHMNGDSPIIGFQVCESNGSHARAASSQHGSKKLDNAISVRVDIKTVREIQEDYELSQKGITY